MDSDLDTTFREAFIAISRSKKVVAPDIMLKFYAYYKQANFGKKYTSRAWDMLEPSGCN